jgi:hypothetical protein
MDVHRKALAHVRKGEWHKAHGIVQSMEDHVAWRIHGLLHRIEGDRGNALYWYRRAKIRFDEQTSVEDEIEAISAELKKPKAA